LVILEPDFRVAFGYITKIVLIEPQPLAFELFNMGLSFILMPLVACWPARQKSQPNNSMASIFQVLAVFPAGCAADNVIVSRLATKMWDVDLPFCLPVSDILLISFLRLVLSYRSFMTVQ
jgi:hypothetical protein